MEGSDLSIRLNLEPTAAVAAPPAVQGQASAKDGQGQPRRHPPPESEKKASNELEIAEDELEKPEDEAPQHRIDSLA